MISAYLESLEGALRFDRSLSKSVLEEVESHLREAVAADPKGSGQEAERRAIESFGDPRVIASQFAVISLASQTRRIGAVIILVIAGVYVAMKGRVAWYAAAQSVLSEEVRSASAVIVSIDRYTFWFAVVSGIGGWAYMARRGIPATFHPAYRKQIRRFRLLCAAATGALILCVASDGALTVLRLSRVEFSAEFLIPVLSMTIEIACVGVLISQIRSFLRRAALTGAMSKA